MAQKHTLLPDADALWSALTKESERYLWFLGYMLDVFDELLILAPEYKKTIKRDLEYHKESLAAVFGERWHDECSDELKVLVQNVTRLVV